MIEVPGFLIEVTGYPIEVTGCLIEGFGCNEGGRSLVLACLPGNVPGDPRLRPSLRTPSACSTTRCWSGSPLPSALPVPRYERRYLPGEKYILLTRTCPFRGSATVLWQDWHKMSLPSTLRRREGIPRTVVFSLASIEAKDYVVQVCEDFHSSSPIKLP